MLQKVGSQKLQKVIEVCTTNQISYDRVIYIGDDRNDLGAMKFLAQHGAYVACPQNAIPAVKSVAHLLKSAGAYGAVAEVIDLFFSAEQGVSLH